MTNGSARGGAGAWCAALGLLLLPTNSPITAGDPIIACLAAKRPDAVWTLPLILREISDLALSDDGRLFAHNDEQGVVVQLDLQSGKAVKAFSMGPPVPRGDFEGMTIVGTRFFLITSRGLLYETREAADGAVIGFTVTDTKLGKWCEIEGLTHEPDGQALLVLCKNPYRKSILNTVTIFRWSLTRGGLLDPDRITVPLDALTKDGVAARFRPSGISPVPGSGTYLMVASHDRAAAVITATGEVLGVGHLKHHAQAEGVAILTDGRILVSDEGGRGPGTVSVYRCR